MVVEDHWRLNDNDNFDVVDPIAGTTVWKTPTLVVLVLLTAAAVSKRRGTAFGESKLNSTPCRGKSKGEATIVGAFVLWYLYVHW